MGMLDEADPQAVGDQAIRQQITKLQQSGEVAVQGWTQNAQPATGWNLGSFATMLRQSTAPVPQFPGAKASMGWLDMAKDDLRQQEGDEDYAYHGILSSHRATEGKRVQPGHGSTEEVSIGYGFNLQRKDARSVFKNELGMGDKDFEAVFNGQRPLEPQQKEKLLEYAALEANNAVTQGVGGAPLRDHQRAALVSLAYNAGGGALRKSGILDLVRQGREDDAAQAILNFNTAGGKLADRRRFEASQFLGSKAERFFMPPKLATK